MSPLNMSAIGGKADMLIHALMSANDPKRTWSLPECQKGTVWISFAP